MDTKRRKKAKYFRKRFFQVDDSFSFSKDYEEFQKT